MILTKIHHKIPVVANNTASKITFILIFIDHYIMTISDQTREVEDIIGVIRRVSGWA